MNLDFAPIERLGLDPKNGVVKANGNWVTNCHKCMSNGEGSPDTKQRLHVCVDRDALDKDGGKLFGRYHCFRCGFKGRAIKPANELDLGFLRQKQAEVEQQRAEEEKARETIVLPADYSRLIDGMTAWDYVVKRGITPADIAYYQIGVGTVPYGRGKRPPIIIFPDYDREGQLCYWLGRQYTKTKWTAKYLNCRATQQARDREIYNLGRFQQEGFTTAILVEGVLNGITAGRNHLAVLGKPSDAQLMILEHIGLKRLYVALDPDARKVSLDVAKRLARSIPEVFLVPVPRGQDINSMGRVAFKLLLQQESMLYSRAVEVAFLLAA